MVHVQMLNHSVAARIHGEHIGFRSEQPYRPTSQRARKQLGTQLSARCYMVRIHSNHHGLLDVATDCASYSEILDTLVFPSVGKVRAFSRNLIEVWSCASEAEGE